MAIDMFDRSIKTGNVNALGSGSKIHEILRNNTNRLKIQLKHTRYIQIRIWNGTAKIIRYSTH